MSELAILERSAAASDEDSAKRRQIVSGARAVFLSQGFDAASMNDIARAAGVSKGTLYVYFKDKEQLFEAIVEQECETQAEGIFDFDPDDHDVEAVLTRLGFGYIRFLCRPEKASAIRVVIAIAERMPKLASYIKAQVDAGVLVVEDCEVAAAQLIEAYQAMLFKSMVFNFVREPSEEQIARVVPTAVKVFLAAYRAPNA